MTEPSCGFNGDRDLALVAFLYDEPDGHPAERALFETHLQTCARCRDDLDALRGVRAQLGKWAPPEPVFAPPNLHSAISHRQWWRQVPAWAQVAAALLFLGVSAGLANLDVRYDQSGLTVRTGWSRAAPSAQLAPAGRSAPVAPSALFAPRDGLSAPWRSDLAALERQLTTEFRAVQASAARPAPVRAASASSNDAEILRRVHALLDESEKRQQRELALRVAEVVREANAQRQADLVKIDRTLGVVQNNLGVEVLKNRQQLNQMNILYRASQRQ
jgi:hypothetical protein